MPGSGARPPPASPPLLCSNNASGTVSAGSSTAVGGGASGSGFKSIVAGWASADSKFSMSGIGSTSAPSNPGLVPSGRGATYIAPRINIATERTKKCAVALVAQNKPFSVIQTLNFSMRVRSVEGCSQPAVWVHDMGEPPPLGIDAMKGKCRMTSRQRLPAHVIASTTCRCVGRSFPPDTELSPSPERFIARPRQPTKRLADLQTSVGQTGVRLGAVKRGKSTCGRRRANQSHFTRWKRLANIVTWAPQ